MLKTEHTQVRLERRRFGPGAQSASAGSKLQWYYQGGCGAPAADM